MPGTSTRPWCETQTSSPQGDAAGPPEKPHLAQKLRLPITEQHQREAVVDAIDGPVWQEGDETADGGERPDGRRVALRGGHLAAFRLLTAGSTFELQAQREGGPILGSSDRPLKLEILKDRQARG